jgi:hypothetical protein
MTSKPKNKTKYLKSDIPPLDLYEDGKRVKSLPTIFERARKNGTRSHRPLSPRAEALVGDARIGGKKFRGKAPIYKLIEVRKQEALAAKPKQ